jgi:chromate transport protein ChrA
MKSATPAVVGILAVSLVKLVPHAAPDAYTLLLLVLAVAALLLWRLTPLPLVLGGAMAGMLGRLKPLQRLKDLA